MTGHIRSREEPLTPLTTSHADLALELARSLDADGLLKIKEFFSRAQRQVHQILTSSIVLGAKSPVAQSYHKRWSLQ